MRRSMEKVKLHDKEFEMFISAEQIDAAIAEVAQALDLALEGKRPLLLGVLNGSFLFMDNQSFRLAAFSNPSNIAK